MIHLSGLYKTQEFARAAMEVAMKAEPEIISVTDLRERTREILENAHFRGRRYVIARAGQKMVTILGVDEYRRLVSASEKGDSFRTSA